MSEATDAAANALQHNIKTKGQNAYYYAHSKSRDSVYNFGGEPQKLESTKIELKPESKIKIESIKNYSWSDGKKTVKIYIERDCIDGLSDEHIEILCEENSKSFCLTLKEEADKLHHELKLPKLHDEVKKATYKKKDGNRLVISLYKGRESTWYQLQDK